MKRLIMIGMLLGMFQVIAQTKGYQPGSVVPNFSLKDVNNKPVSLNDYKTAKGYIVVFTCNTCPIAQAYEDRIIALHEQYAAKGFPVIAINPNDPEVSKGDSFKAMQERAASKKYPFAYLFDPGQIITKQFGAERTPHIYLLSKTIDGNQVAYIGAIDNDTENTNPDKKKYLDEAIQALLIGDSPKITLTKAVGCSVKYKK
ncbi:MAG TPA: thioredoxin family protein [Pseudosphingobacterium sp.]|nr:thioredoxin family protein [Pseudosphingobacterium sp.]